MNVLALLAFANADSVSDTVAREHAIDNVAIAIADAAGTTGDADNDGSTTGGNTNTTVMVMWPGDTLDDPDTALVDESATGRFNIDLGGILTDDLPFRTTAVADTDPDTAGNQPGPQTATKLTHGLPGFAQAYEISSGGVHAIVFTDKVKGKNTVFSTTVQPFTNRPVSRFGRIVPATPGTPINPAQLDDSALYDHDDNPATAGLDVAFGCVGGEGTPGTCTVQMEAGKVVRVVGDGTLTVTLAEATEVGGSAPTDSADYLAFGVWAQEDSAPDTDGLQTQIGAFAGGGQPAGAGGVPAALVGTATYNGDAAGLYTSGDSVDYFHASATLIAKFGTPGTDDNPAAVDDEDGTVSGTIDNIVAGGNAMSDVITLNSGPIETGAVDGTARMGPAKVVDLVASYTYNGTWSGAFYGPGTDNPATVTVEGPEDSAPKAIAGTFGVTGTDNMGTPADESDDVTRSYVGGFGARR
jgi:hypothetical protein